MSRTFRVPGATLTEREHTVPLDHAMPDGEEITVFTREVAAPDEGREAEHLFDDHRLRGRGDGEAREGERSVGRVDHREGVRGSRGVLGCKL